MSPGLEHGRAPHGKRHRVVVLGSSFAGLTAALDRERRMGSAADITVVDPNAQFTFIPSLIWVPFGGRKPADIQFELASMYTKKGIHFLHTAAPPADTPQSATSAQSTTKPASPKHSLCYNNHKIRCIIIRSTLSRKPDPVLFALKGLCVMVLTSRPEGPGLQMIPSQHRRRRMSAALAVGAGGLSG